MESGLKEKIQNDLREAMKASDSFKLSVLRMISAALHNKEIEKRTKLVKAGGLAPAELSEQSGLNEEETIETLSSEVKKRKEAVLEYERGGRQDLADKEKLEINVLKQYLPEELSGEDLKKIVSEAIQEVGAQSQKDFGKVMSVLMPKVKGRADGAKISEIVRELL
ncbi:MAG: GatB/YqeY domain-containing protein [bacterium]|nr:GatB/YqeY domain-containing protein [bacterium]